MTAPVEPTGTEATSQESVVTPPETGISELGSGFLKDVPELERPIVEKYIKDWDAQVTKRFQDVHSEYADFKPLKEAGLAREDIDQSIALVNALNENPQETLKVLADAYGVKFAQEVAAAAVEQGNLNAQQQQVAPPVVPAVPQANPELEQIVNTMATILLAQQQEAEVRQQEQVLAQELQGLTEKYKDKGPYDEKYVLMQAYSRDLSLEDAVKEYYQFRDSLLQQANAVAPSAPLVLGSAGGVPAEQIDFKTLSSKDTKNLVAQMLEASNRERS